MTRGKMCKIFNATGNQFRYNMRERERDIIKRLYDPCCRRKKGKVAA